MLDRWRAEHPESAGERYAARRRRPLLPDDGRLFIVAADHPARAALGVGDDPLAMADRRELIAKLVRALALPGVDGVLATADILDDLAVLGVLDDKIVVGSLNRGGLRGASFEFDDRFTGPDVDEMVERGYDMTKLLLRIAREDAGTARTLEASARAVSRAAARRLPIMLEPFLSRRVDGRVVNDLTPDAVIESIAVASGLGASSAYSWLKLPVVDDMERVMRSTTLPTLLLGGDGGMPFADLLESWKASLALPGVRGLVAGRSLLYPADGDSDAAVSAAATAVHG
ncbi:MAG: deoxyribose-phosphate aldolase [Microbacteriaceae bacterium]|nr:MAG: deoxyribose-phosphate aldolase [Microbacteriaceae bacterium]